MAIALLACSDGPLATKPVTEAASASSGAATDNAAVYWNAIARSLVAKNASSAPFAIRAYAIVTLAQHNSAAATGNGGVHAAISAASVVALSYLYPAEQTALDSILSQYLGSAVAEGETTGRTVGGAVVAYAQGDRFFRALDRGFQSAPVFWSSSTAPVGAAFGRRRPIS